MNEEYIRDVNYINYLTDKYIQYIGGELTAENMDRLSADQHTLLAYRYLRDEVMEGGFIQLIQNGYGPYVLLGPFPMIMKKELGLKAFGQLCYDASHEYKAHREDLEQDRTEEEFMALYEKYDTLNEMGDSFLDDFEEEVTPAIAEYVREREEKFII